METMQDLREQINESVITAFEDLNEEMDKSVSIIDAQKEMVSSY